MKTWSGTGKDFCLENRERREAKHVRIYGFFLKVFQGNGVDKHVFSFT